MEEKDMHIPHTSTHVAVGNNQRVRRESSRKAASAYLVDTTVGRASTH